jgi:hypothetical protein
MEGSGVMARIRSIKPEIRHSEKVNSWPVEIRYFWIMLWGYCDDYGKGKDNAKLIKADSYPLDDEVTPDQIEEWLKVLESDKVIFRYRVREQNYLVVRNWHEHQKPSHPRTSVIPDPPSDYADFEATPEVSGNLPEDFPQSSAKGSPEQRAESREQRAVTRRPKAPEVDNDFLDFYLAYPRKEARPNALRAYVKARKDTPAEVILAGVKRYVKSVEGKERQYIALPATWLNQRRWEDDLTPAPTKASLWDLPPVQPGYEAPEEAHGWGAGVRSGGR